MVGWSSIILGGGQGALNWLDSGLQAPSSDESGWNGYTLRQWLDWSTLVGAAATKLRITMQGGSADTVTVGNVYVQTAGTVDADSANYSTTPIEVLFSGGSGFTSTNGSLEVSDPISISVGSGDDLVVGFYIGTGDVLRRRSSGSGSTQEQYYKTGNDASTVTTSGYSHYTGHAGVAVLEYI